MFVNGLGPVIAFSKAAYAKERKGGREAIDGCLSTVFIEWLFLAFAPKIFELLGPFHILRCLRRWRLSRNPTPYLYTQAEANQYEYYLSSPSLHRAFEPLEYDLPQKYSEILAFLGISMAYALLFPLGLVVSALGMMWTYAVDKVHKLSPQFSC
jgi:hypothetical protein